MGLLPTGTPATVTASYQPVTQFPPVLGAIVHYCVVLVLSLTHAVMSLWPQEQLSHHFIVFSVWHTLGVHEEFMRNEWVLFVSFVNFSAPRGAEIINSRVTLG